MSVRQTLALAGLALEAGSLKGISTREHFQDLGRVVNESFSEREVNHSKPVAALGAVKDVLAYDFTATVLRTLVHAIELYNKLNPLETQGQAISVRDKYDSNGVYTGQRVFPTQDSYDLKYVKSLDDNSSDKTPIDPLTRIFLDPRMIEVDLRRDR